MDKLLYTFRDINDNSSVPLNVDENQQERRSEDQLGCVVSAMFDDSAQLFFVLLLARVGVLLLFFSFCQVGCNYVSRDADGVDFYEHGHLLCV